MTMLFNFLGKKGIPIAILFWTVHHLISCNFLVEATSSDPTNLHKLQRRGIRGEKDTSSRSLYQVSLSLPVRPDPSSPPHPPKQPPGSKLANQWWYQQDFSFVCRAVLGELATNALTENEFASFLINYCLNSPEKGPSCTTAPGNIKFDSIPTDLQIVFATLECPDQDPMGLFECLDGLDSQTFEFNYTGDVGYLCDQTSSKLVRSGLLTFLNTFTPERISLLPSTSPSETFAHHVTNSPALTFVSPPSINRGPTPQPSPRKESKLQTSRPSYEDFSVNVEHTIPPTKSPKSPKLYPSLTLRPTLATGYTADDVIPPQTMYPFPKMPSRGTNIPSSAGTPLGPPPSPLPPADHASYSTNFALPLALGLGLFAFLITTIAVMQSQKRRRKWEIRSQHDSSSNSSVSFDHPQILEDQSESRSGNGFSGRFLESPILTFVSNDEHASVSSDKERNFEEEIQTAQLFITESGELGITACSMEELDCARKQGLNKLYHPQTQTSKKNLSSQSTCNVTDRMTRRRESQNAAFHKAFGIKADSDTELDNKPSIKSLSFNRKSAFKVDLNTERTAFLSEEQSIGTSTDFRELSSGFKQIHSESGCEVTIDSENCQQIQSVDQPCENRHVQPNKFDNGEKLIESAIENEVSISDSCDVIASLYPVLENIKANGRTFPMADDEDEIIVINYNNFGDDENSKSSANDSILNETTLNESNYNEDQNNHCLPVMVKRSSHIESVLTKEVLIGPSIVEESNDCVELAATGNKRLVLDQEELIKNTADEANEMKIVHPLDETSNVDKRIEQ